MTPAAQHASQAIIEICQLETNSDGYALAGLANAFA